MAARALDPAPHSAFRKAKNRELCPSERKQERKQTARDNPVCAQPYARAAGYAANCPVRNESEIDEIAK